MELTAHERRVLQYLDQRGPTHREAVVTDLASDNSKIGWRRRVHGRGWTGGSNGATPLIMGKWCSRLVKAGYVKVVKSERFFYMHHAITPAGAKAIRSKP